MASFIFYSKLTDEVVLCKNNRRSHGVRVYDESEIDQAAKSLLTREPRMQATDSWREVEFGKMLFVRSW